MIITKKRNALALFAIVYVSSAFTAFGRMHILGNTALALAVVLFVLIILKVREKEITPEKKRAFSSSMLLIAMFFLLGRNFVVFGFYEGLVITRLFWLSSALNWISPDFNYYTHYIELDAYLLSAISFVFLLMDSKR